MTVPFPATGLPPCRHTAAWMGADPHTGTPLDEVALGHVCEALAAVGTTCASAGHPAEFRAALVKILAATVAAPMADMTEDEAFKLSLDLRASLYLEMLQFRRAARRDAEAGAFDA